MLFSIERKKKEEEEEEIEERKRGVMLMVITLILSMDSPMKINGSKLSSVISSEILTHQIC